MRKITMTEIIIDIVFIISVLGIIGFAGYGLWAFLTW